MSCDNSILDRDQSFTVHDFGPRGRVGTVNVPLTHGLQPGAMLGIVVMAQQEFYINVFDSNKKTLFHLAGRISSNQVVFNSLLTEKWGPEEPAPKNPILKGVRASITFLYESEGYRIFINGAFILFYKHRSMARPDELQITQNVQVFKVVYNTTVNIIP